MGASADSMQELDSAGTSPPSIPKSPDVEMISAFEKSGESNDVSLRDESLAESLKSMYKLFLTILLGNIIK